MTSIEKAKLLLRAKAQTPRVAASKYPLRDVADRLMPSYSLALRASFAVARKRVPDVEGVLKALKRALEKTLVPLLKKGLEAGGKQTAQTLRVAAFDPNQPRDEEGQWTDSGGLGSADIQNTNLSSESQVSLLKYQNYGYKRINEDLRAGNDSSADVRAIDGAFANEKERNVKVFRGDGAALSSVLFESTGAGNFKLTRDSLDSIDGERMMDKIHSKVVGQVFEDKAYLSVSMARKVALDKFVGGSTSVTQYGGQGLVEIVGRSKMLDVDSITRMGAEHEKERLLPRNMKLRVEDVELMPHPDGERVYLHWKVRIVK